MFYLMHFITNVCVVFFFFKKSISLQVFLIFLFFVVFLRGSLMCIWQMLNHLLAACSVGVFYVFYALWDARFEHNSWMETCLTCFTDITEKCPNVQRRIERGTGECLDNHWYVAHVNCPLTHIHFRSEESTQTGQTSKLPYFHPSIFPNFHTSILPNFHTS